LKVSPLCIVVSLLIFFALQALGVLIVEAQFGAEMPRHTPGFPYNSTAMEGLIELLRKIIEGYNVSQAEAEELLNTLRDIGSENPQLYNLTEPIMRSIEASRAGDINQLLSSINNTDARMLLEDMLSRGNVSESDIEEALKYLESLYQRGALNSSEYVTALEILRRIASYSNESEAYSSITRRMLDIVQGNVDKLVNLIQGSYVPQPRIGYAVNVSFPAPRIDMPKLYIPTVSLSTLAYVALPALLLGLALAAAKVVASSGLVEKLRRVIALSRSEGTVKEAVAGIPRAVANYWRAVRVVEAETGKVKMLWETHREYRDGVSPHLGSRSRYFSELTDVYEKVRFGGAEGLDDVSEELYRKLRGGGG